MRDKWVTSIRNSNYEVNEDGYVRNARTKRVLTNSPNNRGYMTVSLGKRLPGQFVHQLVAEAFVPGYENGLDVDHINGNKGDNRAENLQYISRSSNVKRAFEMGLAHGHKGPNAGTPPKRIQIVETGDIFPSIAECARFINGSIGAISLCLSGKREKHHGYHFKEINNN